VIWQDHAEVEAAVDGLGSGGTDSSTDGAFANSVSNIVCVGSSVNLKSGNLYHSQQVGTLSFSYNSLGVSIGPLGAGWTHDFNLSVFASSNGDLLLKARDGNRIRFSPDSEGVYYAGAKSGDTSWIVRNTDGSYTRTTRSGTIYSFDASGKLTGVTDQNGNATTLTYSGDDLAGITDATGRTTAIGVSGGKISSITDAAGNVYAISYSSADLISSIADPLGNTWSYAYDADERIVQKTDPSGNTTSYTYDAEGRIASSTDTNGMVKTIAYDSTNAVATVTEKDGGVWVHRYDAALNTPLEITDPLGNKTTYTYDAQKNLLSRTYPNGSTESFAYDARGNAISRTDALGHVTLVSYNDQDRITGITDAQGGRRLFTYDAKGNLASYTDPLGALTKIQRDAKGNITAVADPLGHTTQYGYDQFNQLISATDPTGAATTYTYDLLGNVLTKTDAAGNTAAFSYNALGELTGAADPLGNVWSFAYDANGNRTAVTDPLGNVTGYEHNFRGEPTRRVDALGSVTLLAYDGCSSCGGGGERLISLTDPAGSTTHYAYDLRGLLSSRTDPLGKATSFSYDASGRLTGKEDRNQDAVSYTYDAAGNLTRISYPDGSTTVYAYDALDRLIRMEDSLGTTAYTYDAAGRLTEAVDPDGFTLSYAYDAAGNLSQITYPDGSAVLYAYDSMNRLSTVTNHQGETAVYSYDAAGRLTGFTHFNGLTTSYAYDEANRLTGMHSVVASYQFTLDGNGRRTHAVETEPLAPALASSSTLYGYNAEKNRLLTAGAVSYGYDDEGQLTSAGAASYSYDYEHRLTGIGGAVQFHYDGRGNRLRAEREGTLTRYIYDPWGNCMAEVDNSGTITRRYLYGLGLLAMETPGGALYCYHFNALGSTIALTDRTQGLVNSYSYAPFGQVLGRQEAIPQPFQFVGRYGVMTEPNGLYYMRARYYDPEVGRFISEDPIGFAGGDVNLYGYVQNDPVNFIDPDGLDAIYINYDSYPVDTGYGFKLPLGHGAVVAVDPDTGHTRYFEFGRYNNNQCGEVRSRRIPNVKIGKDGLPTLDSLNSLYDYLSKNLGQGSHVSATYYPDSDYQGAINSAERFSKNHPCYNKWTNNCKTFGRSAATACKEKQKCK
jgi:RHS repeat-associated protein